jgi:hypothetical protein
MQVQETQRSYQAKKWAFFTEGIIFSDLTSVDYFVTLSED